jgi:hypothetical protein
MKKTLSIFILLSLIGCVCTGQSQQPSTHLLQTAIFDGLIDGHVDKYLRSAGDRGCVEIERIISDKPLTSQQMLVVLSLIQDSFVDITQIPVEEDRAPRVALLLTRYVELASGGDSGVKVAATATKHLLLQIDPEPPK